MSDYEVSQLSQIATADIVPGVKILLVDPNDILTAPAGPGGSDKWMSPSQLPISFRVFHVDSFGADPTGSTSSDSAFSAAYAAAEDAIVPSMSGGPTGGSLVVYGPGVYKHGMDVVKGTDPRIGLVGPGRQACTIYTTDTSSGDLVYWTDTSPGRAGVSGSAPVRGFTIYGWDAGAGANGFHYGDRPSADLRDISVGGFIGSGSKNYLFRNDNGGLSEGVTADLDSQQGSVSYCFDGGNVNGSFDYGSWVMHAVNTTLGGSTTMLQMINQAHMFGGGQLALRGNIQNASSTGGVTATTVQIGGSGSDTARIGSTPLAICVECDDDTGTVYDLVTDGTSQAGIQACPGVFSFLDAAGNFTAGSVGGSSVVSGSGTWAGPLFSSHGTLTALGSSAAGLVTYIS